MNSVYLSRNVACGPAYQLKNPGQYDSSEVFTLYI